ncbi:MAG: hypothetical protein Q9184_007951 [Pyrenodesmia sp. 2 TL-2023]
MPSKWAAKPESEINNGVNDGAGIGVGAQSSSCLQPDGVENHRQTAASMNIYDDNPKWVGHHARYVDHLISTVSSPNMPLEQYLPLQRVHGVFIQVEAHEDRMPAFYAFALVAKWVKMVGSATGSLSEVRERLDLTAGNSTYAVIRVLEQTRTILKKCISEAHAAYQSTTMDMQQQLLKGKNAAITGGLTGIGRAIAIGFLQHGCNVGINYLGGPSDETLLEQLKAELPQNSTKFHSVAGDISDPETSKRLVKEMADQWGRLDIFVSNAGICTFAELLDIEPDLLSKTIRTNLDGSFYAVQAAARQMASQSPSGGSIMGVSSISALVGGGQQTHYTPTKAGILSLMQSCAVALGKHGIRCNALLPGTIKTQMNEKDLEVEEKRKYMEGRIPLGRTGVTEDMVGPAVFLASDMSRYVTGAQLLVDGGLFVNLQ